MSTTTITRNNAEYTVDEALSAYYPEGYTSWQTFQTEKILSDAKNDLSMRRSENKNYETVILLGEDKTMEVPISVHDFVQEMGKNYCLGQKDNKYIAIPIN
jgi:hypothetical protein